MSNFHMPGLSLVCLLVLAQTPPPFPPPPVQRPVVAGGVAAGQSRDQNQRMPLVGKGSIAGTVLNERGQPVKGARVSLGGGAVSRSEVSSASGEFLFDKLPEGRYSISATRTRYLSGSYGQKRPERSGTSIQLADGEIKKGLNVTLFSASVITGVIYGDDGEPVQNAQVRALRWTMRTGVRRLQSANGASTDDRGMYRLYGLTPGEYVITASSNSQDFGPQMTVEMAMAVEKAVQAAAASGDPNVRTSFSNGVLTLPNGQTMESPAPVTFAPTYYPGTTSPSGALSVTVSGGEERQGIDITLMKVQTSTITGMVVSASGALPQTVTVNLQPTDEAAQGMPLSSARVTPDGRFTLRTVPPGQYNIIARATTTVRVQVPNAPGVGGAAVPVQEVATSQTVSTGRTLVSVDGANLNGVIVTLDGGRSVAGRVVFEGGMPPDLNRTRMTANLQMAPSASSINNPTPQPAPVLADGTFKIANVSPGRYVLRVSGVQNFSVKSSVVRGRDSLDYPFEVENDDIGDALVTMASGLVPTELGGTITDQTGQPAVDYTIVVFSSDQRFWMPGSRRIQTARPGTDGKYTLRGLPAGEYQIAALSDLEPGMQYDLEFLKALLVASTRVTLGDGAKVTQDLRINVSGSRRPEL
ncbi:MAG: carboxypeptidase regulatory-like domain-containing protein [Acidobacteria bacterium]|nr:MAG: carboxypeptidase regulatory-like domain-containing protein [Acidobacteriota bacterium]